MKIRNSTNKIKMIRYIFLMVLLIVSAKLFSQENRIKPEIISSSGTTINSTSIQLSWTLGEVTISTFQSEGIMLTQGFHQPRMIVTGIDSLVSENENIIVYPNPASDMLNIKITYENPISVLLRMTDIKGMLIWESAYFESHITETIWVQNLPNGIYLLSILNLGDKTQKTFKIQKNH
jgi:hypothetical protein